MLGSYLASMQMMADPRNSDVCSVCSVHLYKYANDGGPKTFYGVGDDENVLMIMLMKT